MLSTGVIGVPLPMDRVLAGVQAASARSIPDGGDAAAAAILTTDRGPSKPRSRGDGFVVGGMAKGAGMIHPRLATMLAVVTTDYPLEPGEPASFFGLRSMRASTASRSTASARRTTRSCCSRTARAASRGRRPRRAVRGRAGRGLRRRSRARSSRTARARRCCSRSRSSGAASDAEAEAVARRIATSPLVKTAAFGRDPNWGRVLAAAGSAPWNGGFAHARRRSPVVAFDGTPVFERGEPTGATPDLGGTAVAIDLDLGLGPGSASYLASDLTYDYVRLNAEYTT